MEISDFAPEVLRLFYVDGEDNSGIQVTDRLLYCSRFKCEAIVANSNQEVCDVLRNIVLLILLQFCLLAQAPVQYEVRFPNAVHHEAAVRVTFTGVTQPALQVVLSRSSPGRYALHEFAKNVYQFRASDGQGHPLAVARPNPYEWDVSVHNSTVVVEYTIFGDRADGTYDGIDETHAHLNLPATLAWAKGYENSPASVAFILPPEKKWKVATELKPQPDGAWWAPNLEMLMDGPVEISDYTMREWTIEDARFRLALHHHGTEEEASAYARMCEAVVLEEQGVFGGLPKYDYGTYTFLVDYLPYVSGDGMEHRDSTVITSTGDLKGSSERLIGTVSHEFFHSWNVRRIRPRSLEPFDFERVNMSDELWFAEGFTNYYGPLTLERAGITNLDTFLHGMGQAINAVLTAPGRNVFDVIDMSRMAPFVDAATSIDPSNFANTFISYYTYGQALAFGIDLAIRERFPGKSLDDWMRTMWREHPDINKPYTLDDLRNTLAEATGSKAFATEVFDDFISGMGPMDYASLVAPAGLVLRKRNPNEAWLGFEKLTFSDNAVEIASGALRGGPLYDAGLDKGDRILRWEGQVLKNTEEFDSWLGKRKPGDVVRLKVNTRQGEENVKLVLKENPAVELVSNERLGEAVTPQMAEFRKAWLGSRALHPLPKLEAMP